MKRLPAQKVSFWLLLLAISALPLGAVWWKMNVPFRPSTGGGYANDPLGERSALGTLSYYLKDAPLSNVVSVNYTTPAQKVSYLPKLNPELNHYVEWVYELEYNRRSKTLNKQLHVSGIGQPIIKEWVWTNVSEESIHRVAAPMREIWKTPRKIDAYKGGNLSELKKYGAVLEEVK